MVAVINMRVLHINCNYTGTTLHQNMVEQLNTLGITNEVFVPVHTKHIPVITPAKYVEVSACFQKMTRLFFNYKQHKIYTSLLKSYNPANFDIIHAYTLFTDGNCAYKLSKQYNLPYIVVVRSTDLDSFFKLRLDLRKRGIEIMKKASAICFLSSSYKKQLFLKYIPRSFWKALLKKTYIIPNGIDNFWHHNLYRKRNYEKILARFKQKDLSIVYAGKIDKNKNPLATCKALDQLVKEGWTVHYTAVGKVIDHDIAKQIANRSYAKLLTPLPKEQLISIYKDHDIFVMPSFTETFGLVYAEAMSQALPVIYTRRQGFDNQFKEGTVGFHVSPKKPIDIKNKIISITKDYKHFSSNSLKNVGKFSWDHICKTYHSIYKSILNVK